MRPANVRTPAFWTRLWEATYEAMKNADHLRRKEYQGNPNVVAGHCYVVSEALYHLLGGKRAGFYPMFMYWLGQPHWFLMHKTRGVLDYTCGQFAYLPHFSRAKGKGFLTKKPSKRAREMMELIDFEMTERGGWR